VSIRSEQARHRAVLAAAPCGTLIGWDKRHRQRCACGAVDLMVPSYESKTATHLVRDGRGGWRKCTREDAK
jgi:hypothetical protein